MPPAAPVLTRLSVALAPFLLSVVFAWLVMEGHLSFAGGEKDIFLAIPLMFWSLVYLLCSLILWWRGFAIGRAVVLSAAIAFPVVVVAWLALFGVSWFKHH